MLKQHVLFRQRLDNQMFHQRSISDLSLLNLHALVNDLTNSMIFLSCATKARWEWIIHVHCTYFLSFVTMNQYTVVFVAEFS